MYKDLKSIFEERIPKFMTPNGARWFEDIPFINSIS